jgi:beta-galactosidase
MWDLEIQKQTTLWNTWKHRNNYTSAVKSVGAPMDFISEKDDFSAYPFLVVPAYQLTNSVLIQKWNDYVEAGGHLILTCRTGHKDMNGHFFESGWAAPIRSLIGADIDFFDMLVPDTFGIIRAGASEFHWNVWGEILLPHHGTEVLATYADQYYTGKATATFRPLGKGSVTFIGAASGDGMLERQLVRSVYERAGVMIEDLPRGVYMEWRDGFFVAVNYTDKPYHVPISSDCTVLIGSNPLQPANAIIWRTIK